jgi:hypothetical protein
VVSKGFITGKGGGIQRPPWHTGSNAVAVEGLLLGELLALPNGLFTGLLGVEGSAETTSALLVHLGARGDAIHGHEEQLFRLDFAEQVLDVVEDGDEHFLLGQAEVDIVGVLVCTVVDDAIHIQLLRSVSRLPGEKKARPAQGELEGERT